MAAKDAIVEEKQNKTKTHKMLLMCVFFFIIKKKKRCLSKKVVQGQWMEGALFSEQLGLSLKQHSWMFNFPFFS